MPETLEPEGSADGVTDMAGEKKIEKPAGVRTDLGDDDLIHDRMVGTTFADRYEILERIGSGGWSRVYKAHHTVLRRTVALKLLHSYLAEDPEKVRRFRQEAEAISQLVHPNIVTIYDSGCIDGQPYIIMDYHEGRTLDDIVRGGDTLSVEGFRRVFVQVCDALAAAHEQGIIHRDLKPGNILLMNDHDRPDFVKLLDFGLAKLLAPDGELMTAHHTQTGHTLGTPAYMSPEQCSGQKLGPHSDIYALGCLMYESLTGQKAFRGSTQLEIMQRHLYEVPPPFSTARPDLTLPSEVETIVFKALAKKPEQRFENVKELQQAIERAVSAGPTRTWRALELMKVRRAARLRQPSMLMLGAALVLLFVFCLSAGKIWDSYGDDLLAACGDKEARQRKDPYRLWLNYSISGASNLDRGRYDAALSNFTRAGETASRTKKEHALAVSLGNQALCLHILGRTIDERAIDARLKRIADDDKPSAEQTLEDAYKAKPQACVSTALAAAVEKGQYAQAEQAARENLSRLKAAPHSYADEMAEANHDLGYVLALAGKTDECLPYLREALMLYESSSDATTASVAGTSLDMAIAHARKRQFSDAMPLFQESLTLAQQTQDYRTAALCVRWMSYAYALGCNHAQVDAAFKQSAASAQKQIDSNDADLVPLLHALATHYCNNKEYDLAQEYYRKALELTQTQFVPGDARVQSALADYGEALWRGKAPADLGPIAQVTKANLERAGDVTSGKYLACLSQLACARLAAGDKPGARHLMQQYIAVFAKIPDDVFAGWAPTFFQAAKALLTSQEIEDLESALRENIENARDDDKVSQLDLAVRLNDLGSFYLLENKDKEALNVLTEAADIVKRQGQARGKRCAEILFNRARALKRFGRLDEARALEHDAYMQMSMPPL